MKLNFNKKILSLLILLIPFFKPVGISYYNILNSVFKIWKLISMLIIIFIILKNIYYKKKINFDKNFCGLVIFWGIYLINTVINKSDSMSVMSNAITILVFLSFIEFEYKSNNINKILDSLDIIFTIYIIIHIISVWFINITHIPIFYPIENDYIYFLGTDNYASFQIIPMLTIIIYNNTLKKKMLSCKNIVLTLIVALTNIYTKSYTAALASIVLVLALVFNKQTNKFIRKISIKNIIILYIIFLILILQFNIQNIFQWILEEQMGKGITLNSRTIIWKDAIKLIKNKLLFGYGTFTDEMIRAYVLFGASHAHNFLLEILLRTGIIGTIAYIVFLIKMCTQKSDANNSSILYAGLIDFFILAFMDFYPDMIHFYVLIEIIYYCKYIEREEKKNEIRSGST